MARKRSPYAAVNERRRKREWNTRSTAQLARRRRERLDADRTFVRGRRGERKAIHGLVNTGYLASLIAEARADTEQARAEAAGPVAVAASTDGRNAPYLRRPPRKLGDPAPRPEEPPRGA